jgi:predicted RNase H-like HicB family nuclease
MEEYIMRDYSLSVIFYPQNNGSFMAVCPELPSCFTEGGTVEEAEAHMLDLIAEDLPERVNRSGAEDEEMFRAGVCMPGKIFREIIASIDESGEVEFPFFGSDQKIED